ncbi:MAG: hypothetical protein GY822_25535 [Deltaproteobacteria bacterium]|nr:hypothetical protein [Deltaproteobacteria bacterium]
MLSHNVQGRLVPGELLDFVVQIDNPGAFASNSMRLSVEVDAALVGAAVEGEPQFEGCGLVSSLTPHSTFGVEDLSVGSQDRCTARVPVRIPFEIFPGFYSSTTTPLSGSSAQLSPGASTTFEILPLAPLLAS